MSTYTLLAMPIYCIALGVNPAWIGIAFLIPRFWDAISDPMVGYFSDNMKSRWGRRRPFMLIGGILTGLTYALTWWPPVCLGTTWMFVYFLAMSFIFYTAFTVFIVPYYALGNEITFDPAKRAKVMTWRNFIWGGVTLLAPWTYSLSFSPYFGENEVEGVRVVSVIAGSFIIFCAVVSVISSKENLAFQSQPKVRLIKGLKEACKSKPFVILALTRTIAMFGFNLISPMLTYIITFYTFGGDRAAGAHLWGYIGMTFGITAIIAAPLADKLVRIIGAKPCAIISLVGLLISQLSWYFVTEPDKPYMALIPYVICGPGITIFFAVTSIWLADVCDYDDLKHDIRREGIFSSVFSLTFKLAIALAAGVSGLLVSFVGIVSDTEAIPSPEVLHNLRLMNALVPVLFIAISLFLAIIYPLNEKKMKDIRAQLNVRD
jgi:glycoside/pentoside/hexuronide:cation symporter, GPH family